MRDRKVGETVTEDFGEIFQKFSLWKTVPAESVLRSPAVCSFLSVSVPVYGGFPYTAKELVLSGSAWGPLRNDD